MKILTIMHTRASEDADQGPDRVTDIATEAIETATGVRIVRGHARDRDSEDGDLGAQIEDLVMMVIECRLRSRVIVPGVEKETKEDAIGIDHAHILLSEEGAIAEQYHCCYVKSLMRSANLINRVSTFLTKIYSKCLPAQLRQQSSSHLPSGLFVQTVGTSSPDFTGR